MPESNTYINPFLLDTEDGQTDSLEDLAGTLQEGTEALAPALYHRCRIKPGAARVETTWNASVLGFVRWGLGLGVSMGALYSVLADTLATKVARIGRDDGLGEEEVAELREAADNTISQLNGPFWHVAFVIDHDGPVNGLFTVMNENDATWSAVRRFATERVADIAYDPERFAVNVSYTPTGSDHAVTFTVEQASDKRDERDSALAIADKIKTNWSPNWRAVLRQIRSENPCGMIDKRTKADREKIDVKIGAHLFSQLSDAEVAEYRTQHS